ncbi:MAG: DUF4870 domain-containing protein [Solirubrobacterales bacterium]|jgi:uncharacterized membrane protein
MASPASGPTNIGVAPNVGGLLCYIPCCIGFLFSIVVAVVEKQSRFVRFHAFQSLLLHAGMIVIGIGFFFVSMALAFANIGILNLLLLPIRMLLGLAFLAVLIVLMIKANGGEEFELPVIGEMARKFASGS